MIRVQVEPRHDWEKKVESQGLLYHTTDDGIYWNESACYKLTSEEVDKLEAATNRLQEMYLKAGQYIIDKNKFKQLGIDKDSEKLIRLTWDSEPPAIYGRFDLGFDGKNIKLLEYNADTPTGLIEAAVIQWYWMTDKFIGHDQFNNIHDHLVSKWQDIKNYVSGPIHFASLANREDGMTITYLAETATQAGCKTINIPIDEIGLDENTGRFVDQYNDNINTLFKLYPWENLMKEEFGKNIVDSQTYFIEPAWKMMWSNKGMLAILWELFPNDPLLLPSYLDGPHGMTDYVSKPLISREGANIGLYRNSELVTQTDGDYPGPYVYQKYFEIPKFDGKTPVIGSWVVDGESCGIGIREDSTEITGNTSQFVPHYF